MSMVPIVIWPDVRLSQSCAEVTVFDRGLHDLIGDMFETMYAAPGRGLAAPQIGVMKRVFVMDATWKEGEMSPLACINPVIEILDAATALGTEACLSIPGVSAEIARSTRIKLSYVDMNGTQLETELSGFAAICAQHETDHLNGTVIFDHLAPADRTALIDAYEKRPA